MGWSKELEHAQEFNVGFNQHNYLERNRMEPIPETYDAVISLCHMFTAPNGITTIPSVNPSSLSAFPDQVPTSLLQLSARLGLPLYYCSVEIDGYKMFPDKMVPGSPKVVESEYNPILRYLSMQKGRAGRVKRLAEPGSPRPNILITRADGKEITILQVLSMWTFVDNVIDKFQESDLSDAERNDNFWSQMTAEKLNEWWNKNDKSGKPCPVELGCKACGKTEGVELPCGKCRIVKYCERDCQKDDWEKHKKVCKEFLAASQQGCKACGKDVLLPVRCGCCEAVKYCGDECLEGDWRLHWKDCEALNKA